jgi:hypothetical protein
MGHLARPRCPIPTEADDAIDRAKASEIAHLGLILPKHRRASLRGSVSRTEARIIAAEMRVRMGRMLTRFKSSRPEYIVVALHSHCGGVAVNRAPRRPMAGGSTSGCMGRPAPDVPRQPDSCAYLFLARSDGSDASKLTPEGNGWGGVHPTWTPVGNRIIYGDNVGENVAGNSTAEFLDPGPSLDIGVRLLAKARPPSSPMPAIMCPPSYVFPSLGPPWRSFLLGRKKR